MYISGGDKEHIIKDSGGACYTIDDILHFFPFFFIFFRKKMIFSDHFLKWKNAHP